MHFLWTLPEVRDTTRGIVNGVTIYVYVHIIHIICKIMRIYQATLQHMYTWLHLKKRKYMKQCNTNIFTVEYVRT